MKKAVADVRAACAPEAEALSMRGGSAGRQLMTLAEQIAERIFLSIASGEYAPGDRIREETVAEQLEVSRGPVREALRILEKDSVVRIQPNRGAHVTQLTIKEVGDLFEIRRDLLGAMVRRLAPHNADFVAAIDAGVHELEMAAHGGVDADAYLGVSNRLGRLLADACGNERLADILGSLARQTRRYSMLGLASATRRIESASTWRVMVKALEAGDANTAADAVEDLVDALRREAIRQLALPHPTHTKD
ncbi:GntR family transcriptional regulator [Variovorax sp. J31P207]|uniref:GntR family transcriptional regulator n=1 Tax=Variovorax sp. J31P207 TaxID=3053510 RepID=UPI0025771018|nr:GntR family transcriptional regulator [Variovorax sp. J31P207]MDM0071247.1 GntR family transcriptional regulator [Variovorax sp. J31P207]